MSVIGLTVRCVQNSSLELQKINSSRNFLNAFGFCKSNPSSDVNSMRTCVTLVTNKSVELNHKTNTFVNGQLLQPTIWSKNHNFLLPERTLSEKCTAKSKDNNAEKVTQEEQLSLTNKDRLKKAMKDYGSVVIVFHLTLSWGSLAFLYLLISK